MENSHPVLDMNKLFSDETVFGDCKSQNVISNSSSQTVQELKILKTELEKVIEFFEVLNPQIRTITITDETFTNAMNMLMDRVLEQSPSSQLWF